MDNQTIPEVTVIGRKRYLLGALLRDSHWGIDFLTKREGFHLCYVSAKYAPVAVFFHVGNGKTVHSLDPKEAVKSQEFMDYLSSHDRKVVGRLALMELEKPDYSTWVYRSETPRSGELTMDEAKTRLSKGISVG